MLFTIGDCFDEADGAFFSRVTTQILITIAHCNKCFSRISVPQEVEDGLRLKSSIRPEAVANTQDVLAEQIEIYLKDRTPCSLC